MIPKDKKKHLHYSEGQGDVQTYNTNMTKDYSLHYSEKSKQQGKSSQSSAQLSLARVIHHLLNVHKLIGPLVDNCHPKNLLSSNLEELRLFKDTFVNKVTVCPDSGID